MSSPAVETAAAGTAGARRQWRGGRRAALVFHIDDLHPQKSSDHYESGGDLGSGVMRHVVRLLERHPKLRVTLFTTADWREISSAPTRRLLAAIPFLRDRCFLAPRFPKGAMRLDRHPEFAAFLRGLPRTEIALHGLTHCHTGVRIPVEFQEGDTADYAAVLAEIFRIFDAANLPFARGFCPPGWNAPPRLVDALAAAKIRFLASARDVRTPPAPDALTAMSGLRGVPLLFPAKIHGGEILHFPTNFQATSEPQRAFDILAAGGLLSIKAHITPGMLDSMCDLYANYLDLLLTEIERRFGDAVWWTSMGEITRETFGEEAA